MQIDWPHSTSVPQHAAACSMGLLLPHPIPTGWETTFKMPAAHGRPAVKRQVAASLVPLLHELQNVQD